MACCRKELEAQHSVNVDISRVVPQASPCCDEIPGAAALMLPAPSLSRFLSRLVQAQFHFFGFERWAMSDEYRMPGPIQFLGPGSDSLTETLRLEIEERSENEAAATQAKKKQRKDAPEASPSTECAEASP